MERMDRPRWIGGLIWVAAGVVATLTWLVTDDDAHLGPITSVVVLVFGVATVADRFGAFGAPGASGVSWGGWGAFVGYTESLIPWWPWPLLPAVGATAIEITLGILLLTGHWWRWVGKVAAGLLFVYLVTLFAELGWHEMMTYDMPVLVGGALLVSARGPRRRPRTDPVPATRADRPMPPVRKAS